MSGAVSDSKDPAKVKAGRIGAQKRWGEPGTSVVKLHDLTPDQRRLVLALVEAARSAQATDPTDKAAA